MYVFFAIGSLIIYIVWSIVREHRTERANQEAMAEICRHQEEERKVKEAANKRQTLIGLFQGYGISKVSGKGNRAEF